MKKYFITFINICFYFLLYCQNANTIEIDSFNINILESKNVILCSSSSYVINMLGHPNHFLLNGRIKYKNKETNTINEIENVNILFFDKSGLSYREINDSLFLYSIFFKNKNLRINNQFLTFSKNLKMKDFSAKYQIPKERVEVIKNGDILPFKSSRKTKYYLITLIAYRNNHEGYIELYFNRKGFLEAMFFLIP